MKILKINSPTPNTSYPIYLGTCFDNEQLITLLKNHLSQRSLVVIIYDDKLCSYLSVLQNTLLAMNIQAFHISLKVSEDSKNLQTTEKLITKILELKVTRKTTIITLGGGIVGDIVGFVSSITLRGLPLIHIPTTLLAAVDSSIGGKNGVNTIHGKNLIGTFYNPKAVIVDPKLFRSLPKRDLVAGLAEVIKCGIIHDSFLFNYLANNYNLIHTQNEDFLLNAVKFSLKVKQHFVESDFLEQHNQRVLLNLGHTFGHALEALNKYTNTLLHGEAVAIGICWSAKLSLQMGLLEEAKYTSIIKLIKNYGLPTSYNLNLEQIKQIIEFMLQDKKNIHGNLNLILIHDIGKVSLHNNISTALIKQFLQDMIQ